MCLVNLNFVKRVNFSREAVYLFATGFISILGQVVVLRELNVAFFGIELIYILSLGFWLIGTGIGAAAGGRVLPGEKRIITLFIITALVLLADIVFIRGVRNIFNSVPGAFLPFIYQIIGMIIPLLPLSFLTGLLFQYPAKLLINNGKTLAIAYSIESAGGVAGGLASTLFLHFGVQNYLTALICGTCSILVAVFYLIKSNTKFRKISSFALIIFFILLIFFNSKIDNWLASWNHPSQIVSKDTPYGRVTITESENQICLFENDALSYESESIAAEEFVQLSTLQSEKLDSVLVLGGGSDGIITELLKLKPKKIDYIEINEGLLAVVKKYFPGQDIKSLNNPSVNIIYQDPRQYLLNAKKYDFILVGMPEPMSAQNNRFYTKEFFEQCSGNLNTGGILAFKIASAENIWTKQLIERNKSIYAALKKDFDHVIVLPGVTNIFIASRTQLVTDTQILCSRFIGINVVTRLISPQYINYLYKNDRFTSVRKLLEQNPGAANSDFRPVSFGYTISIWLSKFFPGFTNSTPGFLKISRFERSPVFWSFVIIAFVLFILARKRDVIGKIVLVFSAGLAGMVIETILILNYQNGNGILFQNIGILLMSFMMGLTAGSLLVDKYFARTKHQSKINWIYGTLILIGFAVICIVIYILITFNLLASLFVTSLTLLFIGIFVSAIFAFVSLYNTKDKQAAVSQLYSADLAGGSIGSILASIILIPVYGLPLSIILIVVVILFTSIFFFRIK